MEACQSDQRDHDETASGHQKDHPAACRRGLVETEGAAKDGSVLEHGPSPALPCASSRSDPLEEGEVEGSAQTEGRSTDHETEASLGSQRAGHGSNSGQVHRAEPSCEGSPVHPKAPSLYDA